MNTVTGLHHVTAISGPAQENLDFYAGVLGMRLVKKSVNQDDPRTYHLFYADAEGNPGTDLTFFPWAQMAPSRDGYGLSTEVSLAVPPGSLVYWSARLDRYGVRMGSAETRFGEHVLPLRDAHGLRIALVESESSLGRKFTPWAGSPIPVEHQIRGLETARVNEASLAITQAFLVGAMGLSHLQTEGEWHRFGIGGGKSGEYIDVREISGVPRGAWGTGSIHHIAWRVHDEAHQAEVRAAVSAGGAHPTPVIDRFWFKSVYYKEPGGVLFELATEGPGFAVDEDPQHLGESLVLPPWLEAERSTIEAALPKITFARGRRRKLNAASFPSSKMRRSMKSLLYLLAICLASSGFAANPSTPSPTALPVALPPKLADSGVPQGIVVRTTENVTAGGWVYVLNQCQLHGISRIDLLVKQDEDDFKSLRTGRVLQSGELLVALPNEKTAVGWENSDWLKEMLKRAHEMKIEVWAWWPCFHDAQMAATFPDAAYRGVRGEHFVDAADARAQARQEELLNKLLDTYTFDGVSLDWVRYSAWPDGSKGPLGAKFSRKYDVTWDAETLNEDTTKALWYEMRATVVADWIGRVRETLHDRRPAVRIGAFLLPPQFTDLSQNYPMIARSGLDFLQPMGYWTDWKFPPQWVGEEVIGPYAHYASNGTGFWPTLGIDSPLAEIPVALKSLPNDPVRGVSWFTYGTWEQKTFDKLSTLLNTSADVRRVFGYGNGPSVTSATPPAEKPVPARPPFPARIQAKDFPLDADVWGIVCLGELYRRNALPEHNSDPVCPVIALHTFAEGAVGSQGFAYKCSTAYLDQFLQAISAAGFNVTPLSRLQNFVITGDPTMLPPRPLVLTIDDGSQSVVRLFAPRAAKRRLPYTLALVTSWLSETNESNHATTEPGGADPTMTWGEAKQLYDSGLVEIVSHSDGLHYQASEMPGADEGLPAETIRQFLVERNRLETEGEYERRIRVDMDTSRRKLLEHDFGAPSIFCWPYGEWNTTAKNIARVSGFTHFLAFDPPPIFVSRDSAAEGTLPRVPVLHRDETLPLTFPTDHVEQQAWWLAFLKVGRQSQSRTLLAATLAQLSPEAAANPLAEVARAALDFLKGNAAAATTRLTNLRRAHPFDAPLSLAIDQTLTQFAPGPRPK